MTHLLSVEISETADAGPAGPEAARERRLAIEELLEENRFQPLSAPGGRAPPAGPYRLTLSLAHGRLVFALATADGAPAGEFHLSLTPFRQVLRDYFQIVEAHHNAVRTLPPAKIEAIDMGRRGIHDEGARLLAERLEGKADIDMATARRLFTLICALAPDI